MNLISTKDWTLVSVTYNSASDLRTYWRDAPLDVAEWVVLDNASTDDSADVATTLGATVIRSDSNLGFSGGNNVALEHVGTRYVAFVNPDVYVEGPTLATLGAHIEKHGGLVAPQLVDPNGQLQPNGRGWPTVWAKVLHRVAPHWGGYRRWSQADGCVECVWLMGAFVAAKTDTFRSIGRWNADYFVYYEDAELGIRARAKGHPVFVCAEARAVHGWARETHGFELRAWRNELRSASTFYRQFPQLLLPRKHDV